MMKTRNRTLSVLMNGILIGKLEKTTISDVPIYATMHFKRG